MSPQEIYERRRDEFAAAERREQRLSWRLSMARGAAFLAFLAGMLVTVTHARAPGVAAPASTIAAIALFLGLVAVHRRVAARELRWRELRRINQEALARMARRWDELPLPTQPQGAGGEEDPPLARDLDLFGKASLFHLLGTAHTPPGKGALRAALLRPAPAGEIAARQEAVAELAADLELRQRLELAVRPFERVPPECEQFLRWAEGEPWLLARPWLLWLARALAVVTPIAVVAAFVTPLPGGAAGLIIAGNFALSYLFSRPLAESFNRVEAREREFLLYAEAMEIAATASFRAAHLAALGRALNPGGQPAHAWMARLHHAVELADARHAALLHFPLQLLLLWDFHTLARLERWQRAVGSQVRGWFAALGEIEALAALSTLRHDNPEWCFPTVGTAPILKSEPAGLAGPVSPTPPTTAPSPSPPAPPNADAAPSPSPPAPPNTEARIEARDLGHPLLFAEVRVGNDVTVGPAGTFLLVTGSNMSGKSTLLRALGVNAVLAQAGAPVCAAAMTLPPLALGTSILVEDSLAGGVSFFMAELLRIRQVVEAADRCRAEKPGPGQGPVYLYLLDEILRGTNSQERRIAVRRVLGHLLAAGALGAVSTHDLELAQAPELAKACQPVHFRETLHPAGDGPPMTFDYKLRPGVATTANALRLLAMVGLDFQE
jgi:hypothetical protein